MNNNPINVSVVGLEKKFYEPITTDKIVDGAVTTDKIADGAINEDKLNATVKNALINNIKDSTGTGSLHQLFDSTDTLDFTDKNSALTADNVATYFGEGADISKLPKGGIGNYATSLGGKSIAKGKRSTAEGTSTIAIGNYSHSEGDNTVSIGADSHSEGNATAATGTQSHSEGTKSISSGISSHAEGYSSTSAGNYSHAEGISTKANSEGSHSEGMETEANGLYSHSEGQTTKVLTAIPTTEESGSSGDTPDYTGSGSGTTWNPDEHMGQAAHAEGADNTAIGFASHAEGVANKAYGHYAHAEGISNIAGIDDKTAGTIIAPHAEGYMTKASANYAHSEGILTEASGVGAHSEGNETVASGEFSHTTGSHTTASAKNATAIGQYTVASGNNSFAGGSGAKATANVSFAFGEGSEANRDNSVALMGGKTDANTQFAVGNLLTIDNDGNMNTNGDVIATVGGNVHKLSEKISDLSDYYTKSEIDSKISSVYKYKGSVKTYSLLPTSTANTGDVWNVEEQVARTYYGITVNTIQEIGLGMEDEYGEMVIDSTGASYFATGTTYQICTDSKTILGTMTATSISGNTVHFDYHTNDDYYTTFFAMAEECGYSSDQTWNTWYEGNSINLNNKVFYFYATEWTPPIEEKTVKVIYEAGTNFAWTGTLWDALGGTVDFSDYYTKEQTDNKLTLKANKSTTLSGYGIADAYTKTEVDSAISAAIETTLNTEV